MMWYVYKYAWTIYITCKYTSADELCVTGNEIETKCSDQYG